MKARLFIIGLLLSALVACTSKVKDVEPAVAEHGRSVETPTSELSAIDSLMWQRPDSALAVLIDYLDDDGRDGARTVSNDTHCDAVGDGACTVSTNETFDNHYAQLLASELLFKNNYAQTNRRELLQTVGYFDSLLLAADGMDTRGVSLRPDPRRDAPRASAKTTAFLAARAHYINGAGYYERDSLIEACTEYLNTLRIMESHFAENELVSKKARFMALTYNRLVDLFSGQYMQEPAIYCCKQSLFYNRIANSSQRSIAKTLRTLGQQYDKLNVYDSASYYYKIALENLSNRNDVTYRDVVSLMAFSEYEVHHNTTASLDSLKSMAAQAADESERITRYATIGYIYYDTRQFDSAKVYLIPVFEKGPDRASIAARPLREIALIEGDTLKANEYALILAIEGVAAANNQARVSKLNDLFQTYLQEKQATASLRERKKAVRTALAVVLPLVIVLSAVVVILTRRRSKKRLVVQEAEAQRRLDEASQRLSEATQRHDEAERELQTKVEQAAQHTREMLQQHVTDIYQSNSKDRMQRIREAFNDTYPQVVARLKSEHPELNETEQNILLLNFLHFRIKEEADLLGLSENTVGKYRSNLGKTLGKDPISELIE